jgi:ABC-type phosphate/phosphonate transport system ATPase subunit
MTVEKPDTIDRITGIGAADLTSKAQSGQLSRAYGRDVEVEKVLSALARHRSVLLLGASEVGKTAILHEATQRMIRGSQHWRVADASHRAARRGGGRQDRLPLHRGHLGSARRRTRL